MALGPFTDPKTGRPDDNEIAFRAWYGGHASQMGMNPDPDILSSQYDFRQAFLEGYEPDPDGSWDHRASTSFVRTAGTRNVDRTRPRFGPGVPLPRAATPDEPPPPVAPVNLTPATRDEITKRLAAIETRVATYNDAINSYAKGYVSPDEAKSYRKLSSSIEDYARRMAAHGRTFVRGLTLGEDQIANYYRGSFLPAVSRSMTQGLMEASLGAASFLGKSASMMMPGVSGVPSTGDIDTRIGSLRDKIETEFFGLPSDPIERAGYNAAFPWIGTMIGDLAAWSATIAAPGRALTAGSAMTNYAGAASNLGGSLDGVTRWMQAARGARGLVAANAVGLTGGAIVGAAMAPENERGRAAFEGAFIGLGGAALTSTFLAGRPVGTPARLLKLQTMIETLGAEGVGGALRVAPRLAFGNLARAAVEGSAYTTLKSMGQGKPVADSIGAGVEEGIAFAGYDVAFIGLGRMARWLPIHARIAETWAKTAEALKIPSRMASASGDVANAAMQAIPGALAGGLLGPLGAAVGGAITAKNAAKLQAELASTAARLRTTGALKPETIDKLLTGNYTKMTAEEAESVTTALLKDTVERAMADVDPVLKYAIDEAMGTNISAILDNTELKAVTYERGRVTQAVATLRAQGVLEIDPQMVQATRRLAELTERRSQILLEEANRYPDGLLNSTHSGVMGRVSEKESQRQLREIIETADQNSGLFVSTTITSGKRGKSTVIRSVVPRLDPGANVALGRLYASVRAATGEAQGMAAGVTGGPPTRVLFATNSTILRDLADAGMERAGIDAAMSPEGARALDRIIARPGSLSPNAVDRLTRARRELGSPVIIGENVGRAPGPPPQIGGNLQRQISGRAVAPAGTKGVKQPFIDPIDGFGDESGRIGGGALRAMGGAALGGAVGGATDQENPLRGAMIGAAAGGMGVAGAEQLLRANREIRANLDQIAKDIETGLANRSAQLERDIARDRRIAMRPDAAERRTFSGQRDRIIRIVEKLHARGTSFNAAHDAVASLKSRGRISGAQESAFLREINSRYHPPVPAEPSIAETLRAADKFAAERAAERMPFTGEAGAARLGAFGPLATGAIGALAIPAIARRFDLLGEEDSALTASAVGFLVGAGIGFKALNRNGMRLTEEAAAVARFVKPTVEGTLSPAETARLIGKTDAAFRTTLNGSQISGRRLYWTLPHEQQIEHTVRNIESWPARTTDAKGKSLDLPARREAFETDLKRFAPFSVTDTDWSRITTAFQAATKSLGYAPAESMRVYKGWLGWMTTPLESRARTDISKMNLDVLGRDARNPFATAAGIDELRTRSVMADVVTGPAAPLPRNYRRATGTLNKDGTPAASQIRALVDDIEANTPSSAEGTAETLVPWWSAPGLRGVAPSVRFYRYADRLIASGDTAIGNEIHKVTGGIFQATEMARVADDVDRTKLATIFKGINTPSDMALLRTAIESKPIRDGLAGTNPRVYEAALGVRKFLRDKAEELGLPEFERIEDYLPWVYNYRTKRELKELAERGITPNDVNYPADAPVPRHVFFNHLERRSADAPLGTLMSPYESLLMYSHGANRKIHLDQLLANFGPETFQRIRATQPWIAHDLGRWLLDVIGVPGPGTMYVQKKVEQAGLFLEKFPMFQRPGLAQEVVDKYFLAPGGANSLSRLATGWAFTSKIAWNQLSALTNLSQQIINGGTEYGIINVLSSSVIGANVALGTRIPTLAPILNAITPKTAEYHRLLTERGILSETSQRHFDSIALYEANFGTNRAHLMLTGAPVGAATGALATAILNTDRPSNEQLSVAGGAIAGMSVAAVGAAKSSIMRRALMRVRDLQTFTFNLAETWNRATVGTTAIREARATERAIADPVYAARRRATEVVEGVFTGALGGAGLANLTGGDLLTGAALGGAAAAGATPFAESRTARTARTLDTIRAGGNIFSNRVVRDQAQVGLRPFTMDEVNELYAQMASDITQFRIAKEGRGYFLNTPHGQALGALQSYTLNQAEFVGGRLQSFMETATKAINGQPSQIDFRVFRFASYLLAVGSVYGAILGGANDGESDPDYWVSRLGFGVMPLLLWNDTSNKWEMKSPTDLFKGPLVSDIYNTGNSYLKLLQDERANATFLDTSDAIVKQLFPGARAVIDANKNAQGAATIKLLQDGANEASGQARPVGR